MLKGELRTPAGFLRLLLPQVAATSVSRSLGSSGGSLFLFANDIELGKRVLVQVLFCHQTVGLQHATQILASPLPHG